MDAVLLVNFFYPGRIDLRIEAPGPVIDDPDGGGVIPDPVVDDELR